MHHALKRIDAKTFLEHFSSNGCLLEPVLARMAPKDLFDLSSICRSQTRLATSEDPLAPETERYDDRDLRFYRNEKMWEKLWTRHFRRFLRGLRAGSGDGGARSFSQYDLAGRDEARAPDGTVSEYEVVRELYANRGCKSLEEYFLRRTELTYRSRRLSKMFDRLGADLLNETRLINKLVLRGNLPDLPLLEWSKRGVLPIDWGFCYVKRLPRRDPYEGEERGVRRLFSYWEYDRNDYGNSDWNEPNSATREDFITSYDVQNACAMLENTASKWNRGSKLTADRRALGRKRRRLSNVDRSAGKTKALNRVEAAGLWGLDLDKTLSDGFCVSEAGQFFTYVFLRAILALCDHRCNASKDAFFLRMKVKKKKRSRREKRDFTDDPFGDFPGRGDTGNEDASDGEDVDDDGYRHCVYDAKYNVLFASASAFFKYHAYNFDESKKTRDPRYRAENSIAFEEYDGKRSGAKAATNAAIEKGFSLVERAAVERCVSMRLRRVTEDDEIRAARETIFEGFFEKPLKALRKSEDLERVPLSHLPFFVETDEDLLLSTETRALELRRICHHHRLSRCSEISRETAASSSESIVSGSRLALEYVVRTTRALPKISRTRIKSPEVLKAIEREVVRHLSRLSKLAPNAVESTLREEKVSKLRAVDFFGDDLAATDEDTLRKGDARTMANMVSGDVETLKNCAFFCDEFYSFQNKPRDSEFYERSTVPSEASVGS